jgi:hypothetical protein
MERENQALEEEVDLLKKCRFFLKQKRSEI